MDFNNENLFNAINLKYYDLHQFNNLRIKPSALGICHTNIALLNAYHEDLKLALSLLKFKFQIIGITEHKLNELLPLEDIEIPDYHKFIYNLTKSTHGGTGFYISDLLPDYSSRS